MDAYPRKMKGCQIFRILIADNIIPLAPNPQIT